MANFDFLMKIDIFRKSLSEQQSVLRDFWMKAEGIVAGSGIALKPVPERWTTFRHNYFSVLFIAIFHVLDIPLPRLTLYARLNHCLRAWVTACDNLLDNELKEMILTDLPEQAGVFKSVHTLLVTDRIFFSFLMDYANKGIITHDEMEKLLNISLSSISASGVEEAEEEGGVEYFMSPEEIIQKVHFAKTGKLFTSPLAAPLALGDIADMQKAEDIRNGLCHFGLACQILDDLSDIGDDIVNRKHNYLASLIMHGDGSQEKVILSEMLRQKNKSELKENTRLYKKFPMATDLAQKESMTHFRISLEHLAQSGLPLNKYGQGAFIRTLMIIFGYPDLLTGLRKF